MLACVAADKLPRWTCSVTHRRLYKPVLVTIWLHTYACGHSDCLSIPWHSAVLPDAPVWQIIPLKKSNKEPKTRPRLPSEQSKPTAPKDALAAI